MPRVRWLRPLGYEINIDEALATVIALLSKEVDKNAKIFGNYDVVKSNVEMELKIVSTLKKKDKMVRKLKAEFRGARSRNSFFNTRHGRRSRRRRCR